MAVTRQWLHKHLPAVTDTQAPIEELLKAVFSTRSVPTIYCITRTPAETHNSLTVMKICSWAPEGAGHED